MITLPAASLVSRSFLALDIKTPKLTSPKLTSVKLISVRWISHLFTCMIKRLPYSFFLWDYGYPTEMIRENDINHEFIVSEEF